MPPYAKKMGNDVMQPILKDEEVKGLAYQGMQLLHASVVDILCYVELARRSSLGKTIANPVFLARPLTDRQWVPQE